MTIYAILWGLTLIALIVGLANPKLIFLNNRGYASWYLLPFILSIGALGCGVNDDNKDSQNQNYTPYLTARQMNIYFGSPKNLVSKNSNGSTIKTIFDKQGRVETVYYENIKIVYDWKNNNRVVLLSYSNNEFIGSNSIDISKFSKSRYSYNINGAINIDVTYRSNGSIQEMSVTNPESIYRTTYEYNSDSDMYPYSLIQNIDEQTIKVKVSIDKFDIKGNPTKFTEKFMGNTIETNQTIEYYE